MRFGRLRVCIASYTRNLIFHPLPSQTERSDRRRGSSSNAPAAADIHHPAAATFRNHTPTGGRSRALHEAIVERIAGAAHGTNRIGGAAAVERLAQASDMDVDGALVDIDVAAPHPVEQLFAREHPTGILH